MCDIPNSDGAVVKPPLLRAFGLDEASADALKHALDVLVPSTGTVSIASAHIPAYVGEFAGFAVSVAASITGSAVLAIALELYEHTKERSGRRLWIGPTVADAIARNDLVTKLGVSGIERIALVDLEARHGSPKDITQPFHQPRKGYLVLYRDLTQHKHYYEISTDGEISLYRRYTAAQLSLLEMMEGAIQ